MTIEEHIENLKVIASDMPSDKCADWIESLMAGVEALEREQCGDCISRQALLDKICDVDGMEGLENSNIFAKHYADMVKGLPSITPKIPECGDYISRDYLADIFKYTDDGRSKYQTMMLYEISDIIEDAPPVSPMPKMGKWIKDKCSVCGEERAWYGQNPPYCPDCGAKMQEVEE